MPNQVAVGSAHIQLVHGAGGNAVANATPNLLHYYGGPVISSIKIYEVNWNGNVDATIKNNIGGFYSAYAQSELIDWLDGDYATTINANAGSHSGLPGTNQHIGRGSYGGSFTLSQTATSVTDAQVQTALANAIASGALPAPDANTEYMVNFPHGTTITLGTSQSCVVFCAYHSTFVSGSVHVKYSVLPDMSIDCASGCGGDPSYFNNATSVASHELTETITDGDVGLVTGSSYDYPSAWAGSQGEIGDICNGTQGTLAALQPNGTHYVVQTEYDNQSGNCIVRKAATNDFSLAVSPTSATVAAGGTTSFSVTTALTSGSAQSIALSVAGLPSGVTGTFSPTSVTSGGSATLTISAAAAAAASTSTLTITGTGASATHTASASLTVNGTTTSGIVNGGFETGNLNGWTASGAHSGVSSTAHSGSWSAMLGNTTPTNGDSSIAQTFSVPATANQLSFYYQVHCPDTLTYDWATATLADNTAGTTATVLPKTCSNSGAWAQATAAVIAGHSYTLTLTSHDDNYGSDPTWTLFDDVTLGSSTPPNPIVNGGFETGDLSGWTASGAHSGVSSTAHGGSWSAMLGNTTPTSGDSSIAQTFTVPSSANQLSFWYQVHCPDTLTYDWATATLADNTAGTTATVLPKTCSNGTTWLQATASVIAGHSYTLTLTSHDDNYSSDATYTLFDDVTLGSSAPPNPIVNGDFELGSLSGWTASGAASGVSSTAHGGSWSAMLGSTTPTNGDSSIAQTFTAPAGGSTLSFWYEVHCPDSLTYDWATATLADNTAGTTATVLAKTCSNTAAWAQASASVIAGHSYTLTLTSHDDNYGSDPTWTLFDDVAIH